MCGASCLMTTFSLCCGYYCAGDIRLDVQENFTFLSLEGDEVFMFYHIRTPSDCIGMLIMVSVRSLLVIRWKEWLGHLVSLFFNVSKSHVWVYLAGDQLRWLQTLQYHGYWHINSSDAESSLVWNPLPDICGTTKWLRMKITVTKFSVKLPFTTPDNVYNG
jgi:hypothetical protein